MMKKQVAALLLAINEMNNMAPALVWNDQPAWWCAESFVQDFCRTGGDWLNRLFFSKAYAETIGNGVFKTVSAGTNAQGDVILSGGWQSVAGTAVNTRICADGRQYVLDGGSAFNTIIEKHGDQDLLARAQASGTIISGGQQNVWLNGKAFHTEIFADGDQYVSAGGIAVDTKIYTGGQQNVHGTANGTVLLGGQQTVYGEAGGTIINSGIQEVRNLADSTLVNSGGAQVIRATGTAKHTTVGSGGIQRAEGNAEDTVVRNGGVQYVYGHAAHTDVGCGGRQVVMSGGRATGTMIGGVVDLAEGGRIDATLLPQGELVLQGAPDGVYAVNSLAASGGSVTLAFGKTVGRKLTINALTGAARFVINTDLAQHKADLITVTGVTAAADNQLQVRYDPQFESGQVRNGGSAIFANTPAEVGFQASPTERGAYRYKPVLTAHSSGGRTDWFVDSFVLDGPSHAMQTAGAMTKTALPLWRGENNDLMKRLGELRSNSGCSGGVWLRTYRGRLTIESAESGVSSQYNVLQGGFDRKRNLNGGVWYQGYTAGWLRSDIILPQGSGRTNTFLLGGYGTWMGAKGHFWDIVVKHGWARSHYDTWVESSHVDGGYQYGETSLSLEYGKRQQLHGAWYLEPQAELNLGWLGSATYQNSDGAKVHNGAMYSVVARAGILAGKRFKAGEVYLKASVLREFAAKPYVTMNMDGAAPLTVEQDMRECWLEFSLGATGKINRQLDAYLEFDRTTGKLVKEPWMINTGLRWNF